jgi:hypothetical protein
VTTTPITQAVTEAIEEIRETFAPATITADSNGNGGAWVVIDSVPLGPVYVQDSTWVAFQIVFAYPEADVYPHFVRPDLSRRDGAALGAGFQAVKWGPTGAQGVQLSRRSNRLNPAVDTAATKALKVLKWLNEQ